MKKLTQIASSHISDILRDVFAHNDSHNALVIYDLLSPLSILLFEAYRDALPNATFIDFNATDTVEILFAIDALVAGDFVALVQSSSFRLSAFRIRVELFKKKLKVAEHPHLGRMPTESEVELYVNALAYDKEYFHHTGHTLRDMLRVATKAVVHSGKEELVYSEGFEEPKINIGDYRGMNNIGGQFPIGEVFTEIKEFKNLNGRAVIMAFGDINYRVNIPSHPIIIVIESSILVAVEDSTPEFDAILNLIREEEGGVVMVRELGLGLNRAFGKDRFVSDMGTYERMSGIHLSLGAKHGIYAKDGHKRNSGKFHIDVMLDTKSMNIDEHIVYSDDNWGV